MNFIESTKLPKIQSWSLWMLLASSYTIMLSDNEMALPNIIISEGVLKWFTFSCGVGEGGGRGIFTKILWDGHFGKCFQGGIHYDPSTGTGGGGGEWNGPLIPCLKEIVKVLITFFCSGQQVLFYHNIMAGTQITHFHKVLIKII